MSSIQRVEFIGRVDDVRAVLDNVEDEVKGGGMTGFNCSRL